MADNATVKIGLNTSAVTVGLQAVKNQFAELRDFGAGAIAGTFGAAALAAGVGGIIEKGGQINDLAERFGLTAESVQRIGNAAAQNGSSLEGAAAAMNKLALAQEKVRAGDDQLSASVQKLGIDVAEFSSLSPEEAFFRIADAVSTAEDRQAAYAAVIALMGKSSGELFTTLEMGADAIRELGESVGVMSDETIAKLDELGDAIDEAKGRFAAGSGELLVGVVRFAEFLGRALSVPFGGSINSEKIVELKELTQRYVELTQAAQRANAAGNTKAEESALAARAEIEERLAKLRGEAPKRKPRDLEPPEDEKAAKEKEQKEQRLGGLRERLAEAQRQAQLDQLDGEEKINELIRQRAELQKTAEGATDPEKQVEAQLKVIALTKQIRDARERADEEAERGLERALRARENLESKQQNLRDKQFSNFLAGASDPEKLRALEAKRKQLMERAKAEADASKRADIGAEVLDVDAQIAAIKREKQKDKAPQTEVVADRLTRIGLGGGAVVRTRDPAEASANSLKNLEGKADRQLEVLKRIEQKDPTWSP